MKDMTLFPRWVVRRTAAGGAICAALALGACSTDTLLEVPDPDVATPQSLASRAALPALLAGAQSDFQVAFGGAGGDSQTSLSALFTDEFYNIETFPTRIEVDTRQVQEVNATMLGIYRNIQLARASAERAAAAYKEYEPTAIGYSEALSLAGYSYIVIAENYCSGVPFSTLSASGELVYGQQQTTAAILNAAIAKFDSAITVANASTGSTSLKADRVNLARIGRGRALLNLGRFADAAAAVNGVPTSYRYQVQFSENSGRQNNGVFLLASTFTRRFSGTDVEGQNGLPYRSSNDARVAQVRSGVGFDGFSPAFYPIKYTARTTPITLADGVEARLIEAEAALQAGDRTTLRARLNDARAAAYLPSAATPPAGTALPGPLADADVPATRAGQTQLLFRERAFALYLTSHRLGDLRRLVRQYGFTQDQVFPTGPYAASNKATGYGNDVNFPIPFEERNNPNFTNQSVCLDRNA